MKTKFNFNRIALVLLMTLFTIAGGNKLFAGDKNPPELKDFIIIIEETEDGLMMRGAKGCAWINLSFSLKEYVPQAVDEFGMTELEDSSDTAPELADFLFKIIKTENGITIKGLKGTAWSELKSSLNKNEKVVITQTGVTSLD